jgi:acyl-coenzyme A synthetase/AMP-(fatty) acid ligase
MWRAARDRPDAPAVIAYENGAHAETLTFHRLSETVDRFGGALPELGVDRGDVVVVHLPNCWMLSPLYLACARIGISAITTVRPMSAPIISGRRRIRSAITPKNRLGPQ